jgi:biopolymer transport protein ExbB/TolQ
MVDEIPGRVMVQLEALAQAGGIVMWPLLLVGLAAWTLLLLRAMTLFEVGRIHRQSDLRAAVGRDGGSRELWLRLSQIDLRRHGPMVDTLVAAAPLLGLLGTVSGMITTFDGLTSMTLFSESGGIAGGIAEALTTTQAGLMVAIPAFFANRVIGRKAAKLSQQLDAAALEATPRAAWSEL